MTVDPGRQGMEFLWAALLGIGLGFLYDLGRGVRREKPRLTIPVDMLFSLVFLLSLSLTAVYTRGLRLYQCLGVFLGAGAYFVTVSPPILRQWRRFLRGIGRGCGKIRRTVKKSMVFLRKLAKKLFPSSWKWGTIKNVLWADKSRRIKEIRR